jgi:hypothetical protein
VGAMEHLGRREGVLARAATNVSRLERRNETDLMKRSDGCLVVIQHHNIIRMNECD